MIKYSATLADGSNLPDWLNFNSITRTFSGTPNTADIGKLDVKAIATDKTGATVSDIFTLIIPTSIIGTSVNNTLTGAANEDLLEGLEGNDTLLGLAGNDTLDGGTGRDTMTGGLGDDTYIIDNAGDKVIENTDQGTDTVRTSISYTLSSNLENLILTGTGNISGTGNALNNLITGNSGNNRLDAKAGNDTLKGGAGNDSYYVDSVNDQIVELVNEGTDTVFATISWTLGDNLEKLILTGSDAIDGTGNGLRNTITGNSGNNKLFGGGDNDILNGGIGDDTLNGGAGRDRLTGGTGNDRFVFASLSEGIDTITDFNSTDDILVLQTLFSGLNYTGTNPIADGYFRAIQSGLKTLIQIDADGLGGGAGFSTLVTLSNFDVNNFSQNNLIF